jgi:hypothetical protein
VCEVKIFYQIASVIMIQLDFQVNSECTQQVCNNRTANKYANIGSITRKRRKSDIAGKYSVRTLHPPC